LQTQSHLLLTWFLAHKLGARVEPHMPAVLAGSLAPDLPLFLLTAWFFAVPRRREGADGEVFGELYDAYFFEEPLWIVAHNVLHAPFILAALMGLGLWLIRRGGRWGEVLVWFTAGCALHSLIDTFTHHNDGPLLLFPFDWSFRFASPVSYWHPDYFGTVFMPLELAMNVLIVGYFVGRWLRGRQQGSG